MSEVIVRGTDGQDTTFRFTAEQSTVADLKQKIFEERNIAVRDQRLLYGGKILEDARTLESYNINDGFVIRLLVAVSAPGTSTLNLNPGLPVPNLDNVFVKPGISGGRTLTFNHVPVNTTIERFKAMIAERTGDDTETIRLIYGGKEFVDTTGGTPPQVMTLVDYGVSNNATLQMVFRLPGGGR